MPRTSRSPEAARPPTRRRAAFVPIDRPRQLEALASPLRQEIVDALDAAGPCSIAELARHLDRAPDSLYFHLRRLVKTELVVEVERRQAGRHAFVVVDVAGRPLRIDRAKARPAQMQAVVGGILRLAARDFRRGHGRAETEVAGAGRNHAAARVRGWVGARDLGRINALLEELGTLVRTGRPGLDRQPIALAWVLAPAPGKRAARAPSITRSKRRSARRTSGTRASQ